jgi:hypothetical protein
VWIGSGRYWPMLAIDCAKARPRPSRYGGFVGRSPPLEKAIRTRRIQSINKSNSQRPLHVQKTVRSAKFPFSFHHPEQDDMQTERSATILVALAVGVALTINGCGSSEDGAQVKVSPEVQKKTDDMLTNMHKNMQDQHKSAGKAAKPTP